jgi:hypothetical protein
MNVGQRRKGRNVLALLQWLDLPADLLYDLRPSQTAPLALFPSTCFKRQ